MRIFDADIGQPGQYLFIELLAPGPGFGIVFRQRPIHPPGIGVCPEENLLGSSRSPVFVQ
jgi:hypothetical protein